MDRYRIKQSSSDPPMVTLKIKLSDSVHSGSVLAVRFCGRRTVCMPNVSGEMLPFEYPDVSGCSFCRKPKEQEKNSTAIDNKLRDAYDKEESVSVVMEWIIRFLSTENELKMALYNESEVS